MKKSLAILALMVLAFSSCLKEKYRTDFTSVPDVVEQPYPGFAAKSFPIGNDPVIFDLWANLASVNVRDQALTVTFSKDQAALDAYNAEQAALLPDPTTYVPFEFLPDSTYSLPATTLTIAAGERHASIPVSIFPNKVDPTVKYIFAYTITDAQGITIAENRKTTLYSILIKNIYDGKYHATGYFQHPTSPRPIDRDVDVTTINGTTSSKPLGDLGSNIFITVNADNSVSIAPDLASGSPASTVAVSGDPVYNNTYDPATKTFYLKYSYIGGSGPRVITEIVVPK